MKALFLFVCILLSPACFLHAQIDDRPLMKVDIPFAFTVENARLPAGSYLIYEVQLNRLWRVSSADRKRSVLFHISAGEARPSQAKLTFLHYPTDYVLRRIEGGNDGVVASLFTGKRERQLASNHLPIEEATVNAQSE